MAKATRTEVEVLTTVPGVTLELTAAEAEVLAVILSRVGGSPEGPRGQAEGLCAALKDAGYDWENNRYADRLDGHLMFDRNRAII